MLTGVDLAELAVGQALVESSKPCAEEAGASRFSSGCGDVTRRTHRWAGSTSGPLLIEQPSHHEGRGIKFGALQVTVKLVVRPGPFGADWTPTVHPLTTTAPYDQPGSGPGRRNGRSHE